MADPVSTLPRQFGDYELLAEIGRGGFGTIYQARQCCLNRLCAVKMLHKRDAAADAALTAEAQAAAMLDHPNIVGIYEVGREEGRLFFSMEFVEGQNLATFTRAQVLSAVRVATYARKVAEAVHYAHSRGVLHCDLKPANVIIDPADEPQITDFGLARQTGRAAGPDAESEGAGSPNFMAPEQCDAHFGDISQQTDVFGLGAILYYLLTDRPPFRGETLKDTLRAVTQLDPVPPRVLRPGVPRDLETICLRCLEKRPTKRYRSAKEVADELERFLNDEPIHARPINPLERVWRRARRHPWLAGFASATLVLLGVVTAGSTLAALRIEEARQQAENGRQAVTLLQKRTAQNLYAADLALAFEAWNSGNYRRVREILDRHRPTNGAPDLRGWEWKFLAAQAHPDFVAEFGAGESDLRQLALADSGRLLIASDTGNRLRLWSLPEQTLLKEQVVRSGGGIRFTLSPDGRQVAITDRSPRDTNTTVRLLSLPGLETNQSFSVPGSAGILAFASDGRSAWFSVGQRVQRFSVPDGRLLGEMPGSPVPMMGSFAFSPDTARVAIAEADGVVALRRTADGSLIARVQAHERRSPWEHQAYVLRFSADGSRLASGGSDGTVALWDGETLAPVSRLAGHQDLVTALAFSGDGRRLVATGRDPELFVWNLPEQRLETRLRGNADFVFGVEFLPDSDRFITAGNERVLRIWKPEGRQRWQEFADFPTNTTVTFLMPDRRHFFTAPDREGELTVRRIADGSLLTAFQSQTNALAEDLWVSAEGRLWGAMYQTNGTVEVGPLHPPGELQVLRDPTWVRVEGRGNAAVAFSPDGSKLAVGDASNGVRIWNLASSQLERPTPNVRSTRALHFSPDGRHLIIISNNGEVHALDVSADQLVKFSEPVSFAQLAAFSPDHRLVAVPGFDGTVRVFELATGKVASRLTARTGSLLSVGFSPDGTRLFAGGLDGYVTLWDLTTGRELASTKVHRAGVFSVGFDAAGRFVSCAADAVRIWLTPELAAP